LKIYHLATLFPEFRENSKNSGKIRRIPGKFTEFRENSQNSGKIRRIPGKFATLEFFFALQGDKVFGWLSPRPSFSPNLCAAHYFFRGTVINYRTKAKVERKKAVLVSAA
jgi:hypothetical protein